MVDVDTPPYADEVPRGDPLRETKGTATRRGPVVVAVLALVVAIVAATVEVATPASLRLDGERLDVAAVVAAVEPSVVSIETEIVLRRGRGSGAGTGVV